MLIAAQYPNDASKLRAHEQKALDENVVVHAQLLCSLSNVNFYLFANIEGEEKVCVDWKKGIDTNTALPLIGRI